MAIAETQVQAGQQNTQDSACDKNDCCSTTEDGSAVCMVPQNVHLISSKSASCGCASATTIQTNTIETVRLSTSKPKRTLSDHLAECSSMWQKIRGGVMFIVACIASPCCTPLIVPVVLALLAGTPVAVWMGQNLGWVYGGLTVLSVISFVLAFRWMSKSGSRRTASSLNHSPIKNAPKSEISSQSL